MVDDGFWLRFLIKICTYSPNQLNKDDIENKSVSKQDTNFLPCIKNLTYPALTWIWLPVAYATPSMFSMNKLTFCRFFRSAADFCRKILQMKVVEVFMACKVYRTPMSLANRAPPGVFAALSVTVYWTASFPWIADINAKQDNITTNLAIAVILLCGVV